jgi:hypothetical protein
MRIGCTVRLDRALWHYLADSGRVEYSTPGFVPSSALLAKQSASIFPVMYQIFVSQFGLCIPPLSMLQCACFIMPGIIALILAVQHNLGDPMPSRASGEVQLRGG